MDYLSVEQARKKPGLRLVPTDMADRTAVLGLSALVAGVDGFGWNRRLQLLAPIMALDEPPQRALTLAGKYGWSEQALAVAAARLQYISAELDRRLAQQQARGSEYLVGNTVSAADLYWANFAGMVKPLGHDDNPMPDYVRATYQAQDAATLACVTPRLEAHRNRIYQRHITLPLDF